jgi:hypothetical protein
VDTEFIVKHPGCLLTACDQIAKNGGNIRPVELKTQLAVIPGGLTSQMQPPYVAINKTLKALMCEKWIKWTDELWVTTAGS